MKQPIDRVWLGEDPAIPLINTPTPPAAKVVLAAAINYPVDAAVTPYCGCARVFDSCSTDSTGERYLAVVIAPGAAHAQAAITRAVSKGAVTGTCPGGPPYDNLSWTATGGSVGADIVTTSANADPPDRDYFATYDRDFHFGVDAWSQQIVVTADTIDDAPAATEDRRYTLQTLAHPYVEPMYVTCAAGFSVYVSQRIGNLEDL